MIQGYKNLPGQLVEFKDGGLVLRNTQANLTTKSMLILGTAKDGPKDPVAVDINTVDALYGKDVDANGIPNGATIPKAVHEAYRAGCRDIRVMRITGETATSSFYNPEKSITKNTRFEQLLGYAEGNEQTSIVLSKTNIIASSIVAYAKGVQLPSNFTFTQGTSTIAIPADVCDAGAALTFKYDYTYTETNKDIKEYLIVNGTKNISLAHSPVGPVTIKNGNTVYELTTDYTLTGSVVLFTDAEITPGTIMEVTYKANVDSVVHTSENGNASGPYKAATGTQVFTLSNTPIANTAHLYTVDGEVLTSSAFAIDYIAKTLTIFKENFSKGAMLTATYFANVTSTVKESITSESIFAGSPYNEGLIEITDLLNADSVLIGKKITVTKPSSKKYVNEAALEYTSIDYPTFGQLVDIMNRDLRNGTYKYNTDFPDSPTSLLQSGKYYFGGGEDGLGATKVELFEKLSGVRDSEGYLVKEGVYQLLENYIVDYVVLTGCYADDEVAGKYDNFAYELALFCAVISHRNRTTYGFIEMKPCTDTSLSGINAYANRLAAFNLNKTLFLMKDNGKLYVNSEGENIDLGMFIRVVGGAEPLYMSDTLGLHYSYPAVTIAAFQTTLAAKSSPMNKRLPNSKGVRFRFSNPQLDKITGNNIITFKQKYGERGEVLEGAFVVDSMTCALPGSDYTRTTTCECVKETVNGVLRVCDPFLGEANTVEQKNSMAAKVSKELSLKTDEGTILGSSFQIIVDQNTQGLGKAKIELTLVTPEEMREITTVVGLTPSL